MSKKQTYTCRLPARSFSIEERTVAKHARSIEEETLRQEHRRILDDPLSKDFHDWPKYFMASRLSPKIVHAGIEAGVMKLWRFDSVGRAWLELTPLFYERIKNIRRI